MNLTANRAGHFGLLALLAGFTLWFTASAWEADATLVNMILIGPVAVLALGLIAAIGIGLLLNPERDAEPAEPAETDTFRERWGVAIGCLALALYVLSLETIGFDVAGVIFCAACMVLMGRRNWLVIVAYSLFVGLAPVWILEGPMGIPVHTLILE
ncbi:MAG: tripartite tricarboxylate transporter TctB family protein [Rhodobacteraceae bacterium]|nr:tripartite tricarboxylate transporter TctB family protein [Paracoccaceae bacterium]